MTSRHIKRLPVVEAVRVRRRGRGKLIGIVSRRDLLGVFLRPDEDIAADVREMLAQLPQVDRRLTIIVRDGIVNLTGLLGSAEEHDLIRVAGRLAWDVDGVVDVVNSRHHPAGDIACPAVRRGAAQARGILDMLGKPEELVGVLSKPGEFIASAYDFASTCSAPIGSRREHGRGDQAAVWRHGRPRGEEDDNAAEHGPLPPG